MTAFGRASHVSPFGALKIEIQSVNRKHLEINIFAPRSCACFEIAMRKWIEERVGRGQISASLSWYMQPSGMVRAFPNKGLAQEIKKAWEEIAHSLGLPLAENTLFTLLSQQEGMISYQEEISDEASFKEHLEKVVKEALDQCIGMRLVEGEALAKDLLKRVSSLGKEIEKIAERAGESTEKYRKKLEERVKAFFTGCGDNEEKVLREVALFADKVDITEEVVRFRSHLGQLELLLKTPLKGDLEAKGKTMEFLTQELLRESHTMSVKVSDLESTQTMILIKSDLEKLREQIQNIE